MTEKMEDLLFETANKLGVAVEHLVEVMIRQQIVSGIVGSFMMLLFVLTAYLTCRGCYKAFKAGKLYEEGYNNDINAIGLIWISVSVVLGIVAFAVFMLGLPESIMSIFNPEYYALKDIINIVKGE
ncbi:hypothetical protein D1872_89800 [compost metagenome]